MSDIATLSESIGVELCERNTEMIQATPGRRTHHHPVVGNERQPKYIRINTTSSCARERAHGICCVSGEKREGQSRHKLGYRQSQNFIPTYQSSCADLLIPKGEGEDMGT
jgi:hypothetical protein